MPKVVDHDARRAEIAIALRRVILAGGVGAASVRTVAAEAGWSAGAVRHYFPDQAALVRFAVTRTVSEAAVRIRAALAAPPGRRSAELLLEQVLPLDDLRRVETHLWLAILDQSRLDPQLDALRAETWLGLRLLARTAVCWVRGLPTPTGAEDRLDADGEDAAACLHAAVDGLALHGVYYPEQVTPDDVRRALADQLDRAARPLT